MFISNLHPIWPEEWPSLEFVKGKDINELMLFFRENKNLELLKAIPEESKLKKKLKLIIPPIFYKLLN
jgi:hypothetical protein